jgi:hypothetical protein
MNYECRIRNSAPLAIGWESGDRRGEIGEGRSEKGDRRRESRRVGERMKVRILKIVGE